MPIYEYRCTACEQRFDVVQSIADDPLTALEGCDVDPSGQHPLKKVFSAVGISFKGEGFYRNDARPASKKPAAKGNGEGSSDTSASDSSTGKTEKAGGSGSTETKKSGTTTASKD